MYTELVGSFTGPERPPQMEGQTSWVPDPAQPPGLRVSSAFWEVSCSQHRLTLEVADPQGSLEGSGENLGDCSQALRSLLDVKPLGPGGGRAKPFPEDHLGLAEGSDGCLALWRRCRAGAEVGQVCCTG